MSNQMIIRIDPDLKKKVHNYAKIEGKSISGVVRELLEEYVKTRDIDSYVDNLWERIGGKLTAKGIGPRDIESYIQEVRTKH